MTDDQMITLDKELAELLGYTDVKDSLLYSSRIAGKLNGEHQTITRWTLDNAAAFELMCEQGLCVGVDRENGTVVVYDGTIKPIEVDLNNDITQSTRQAIVRAVIAKLKGNLQ